MPLGKDDNPATISGPDDKATKAAVSNAMDEGAGAPDAMREAAEALPEKDDVQKAIKEGLLADDAQTEAKAKAKVVDLSPDSDTTPSGIALKASAGESDDVKRGEKYSRIKGAVRHGYVPAEAKDLK